jgi:hypothetical protein
MLLLGYGLLALVVAAVLFYLVVALLPAGLSQAPQRDNRPLELPTDRRVRLADLDRVRIPVSVRGYRFAETDELIDRLAAEIVVRDEEIARLRATARPDYLPDELNHHPSDHPAGSTDEVPGQHPEPEWAVRELGAEPPERVGQDDAAEPAAPVPDTAAAPGATQAGGSEPAADQAER